MYTKENIFSQQSRINSFQLAKLHTFEVVARHSSFSLAAEELSLTPSAISHRINKLEQEIGIRLFIRSHRKITLTEQGLRIYQSLTRTLNDLNQDILDVKNGDISGPLTIYSRPSFAQSWLVPRIHSFKQNFPSIDLKLLTGNEKVNFKGYGIDLAIYFDDHMPDKLFCKELMAETIIPVCTRDYAQRYQLEGNMDNLRHTTLLHDNQAWGYDSNQDEWNSWAQANHFSDVSEISSIGFDRSDLALVAALNNAGVAMGRYSQIKERLSSGELVAPFPDTEVHSCQKYYFATASENHSPKVKLFIEWLEEQAK